MGYEKRIRQSIVFVTLALPAWVRAQMPATKVVVVEARTMEAVATVTLVGTVNAARRSSVGAEMAGLVTEMPVRQGDRVQAGQVLCRLDVATLSFRLAEAKARLGSLQARQEELINGTRPEELRRLKAVLEEAQADYDRWQFEADRIEQLYQDRTSNAKEYTDSRMLFAGALNRKIAAQANYEQAINGTRKETLAQASYEVAVQQAIVDRFATDLKKTAIAAPFAGYVTQRFVEVGEWLPEGGNVVQMVDLSTVLVKVDSPESAMPFLSEQAPARVQVDALKRSFEGRIRHVIRQADERARTFPIEIEVDNKEHVLAAGMFARVTIPAGPASSTLAVPKDAVVESEGIPHVGIVMPGAIGALSGMLTPVTLGSEIDRWIAVTSGNVREGSRVITRGNERLMRFPMPVELVDEQGNPVAAAALPRPDGMKGGS